jgi:hypothetical protein
MSAARRSQPRRCAICWRNGSANAVGERALVNRRVFAGAMQLGAALRAEGALLGFRKCCCTRGAGRVRSLSPHHRVRPILVLTLMERAMAVNWKEIDRKRAATGKCAGRRSTWCSWQSGFAERARKAAAVIG